MTSLWMQDALKGRRRSPKLAGRGDERFDVAVVGGGFSGLWTAMHLRQLEPGLKIALLERDHCGSGAAGRNAGFVLDWWSKLPTLEKLCGPQEAVALCEMTATSVEAIGDFCADFAPAAEFKRAGWLWAASNQAQVGAWSETRSAQERTGIAVMAEKGGEEVADLTGSARFLAGAHQTNTATVHPGQLTLALKDRLEELGVTIFEGSPVRSIAGERRLRVASDSGCLQADRVVLATSSWLAGSRLCRRLMFVVGSDVAATEPIPDDLPGALHTGVGVTDAAMLIRYARATERGNLLVGRGGSGLAFGARERGILDGWIPPRRAAELRTLYEELYPDLAARVPLTRSWTGPVDRSWTGLPFVGVTGGGRVAYAAGYSGNGVGPSHAVGRMLSSLVLDRDDRPAEMAKALDPSRLPPAPPVPITYLGGRLVRAAVARKEGAEDRGGRASGIVRATAGLAPTALVPTDAS